MKILWLGPIVPFGDEVNYQVISPAANIWQISFLQGLIDNGIEITCLSYIPCSIWPNGPIISPIPDRAHFKYRVKYSKYLNFPFLKKIALFNSLKKDFKVDAFLEEYDYLITYNTLLPHLLFAKYFKKVTKKKWISIIADNTAKGNPDLNVFLSHGYYNRFKNRNKYHFDEGVPEFKTETQSLLKKRKKVLLYSGTISKWTGITEFAEKFSSINNYGLELHIYGKGSDHELNSLAAQSNNIKIFGFVSKEILDEACKNADFFLNPRSSSLDGNRNNFPSKLLNYISYGKPILSTKTEGISDEYEELIFWYYSVNEIEDNIKMLFFMPDFELETIKVKCKSFCEQNSWKKKINAFLFFLEENNLCGN